MINLVNHAILEKMERWVGPETNTSADNLLKHKFCRRGILSKCTFIIVVQKEFNGILKRSHTPIAAAVKSIQSCPTLYHPMNGSMPGLLVLHQILESTQTHVHWVSDAIQQSHLLLLPSPSALNLSQHLGLFKWVRFSHQVAKVLEFQHHNQSIQWTPRTDLL